MSRLNRIERRLEPFAIPNLTLILVAGQLFMLVAARLGALDAAKCVFVPALVSQGEWWRLLSFIFMPPTFDLIWAAFGLYLIYLYGSALEAHWGCLRHNLFILLGYALTVAAAFATPHSATGNVFVYATLFLAFAYLHPDFEIHVFFVLPVKIKWLALIMWLGCAFQFFTGGPATRLAVAASVGNFLVFFSRDLWRRASAGGRRMAAQAARIPQKGADTPRARHRCHVCGKTSDTHPLEDFRYCSKCAGDHCYCSGHIRGHEHVVSTNKAG